MATGSTGEKVDPVTGLTDRETNIIQTTWAILKKDLVATGVDVMISLFDAHPDYQSYFASFKNVPRDELPSNKRLQAHGVNVVKALGVIIDGLTDTSCLVPYLEGLGSRHFKRGLREQHFENMTVVMIGVLRRNIGKDFTQEVEEAWRKTMTGAWSHLFKADAPA